MRSHRLLAVAAVALCVWLAGYSPCRAEEAMSDGRLLVLDGPHAVQVKPSSQQVTARPGQSGIDAALLIEIAPGDEGYPGVGFRPGEGAAWDLSRFGHVVADVTNDGDAAVRVMFRVDNEGDWRKEPWNTEAVTLKPGETKPIKVIFGYAYGYKPGYKLDPGKVSHLLLFTGKVKQPVRLRLNSITAGGEAGETPPVNPANVRVTPKDGVMLGEGVDVATALRIGGKDIDTSIDDGTATVTFKSQNAIATIKPAVGKWNLTQALQVEVTLINAGEAPVTPLVRVQSDGSKSPEGRPDAPIQPGESITLIAPFRSGKPWIGPDQIRNGHMSGRSGTGNHVLSDRVSAVTIDVAEASGRLVIRSIVASAPVAEVPQWLGKRPPVEGDWVITFEDEFDGDAIDTDRWNIYTANYWDTRSHFSKDNVIVADGKVRLRYEKKRGYVNDDPNQKLPKTGQNESDYAVGFLDTYGKWTQTYGYFEARMKLPTAPGLWPAFWMMPDRGEALGPQWKRADTKNGGMEFDIMEHLTRWGPYRYNIAFHWDGYDKEHKATGSTAVYTAHDSEGYITAGLLWLPGQAVYYANGQEVARWDNDRISNVPSYPILYMVSGGWDNNALDDSQLPADFTIDYIRVWQRKDLLRQQAEAP